MDTVQKLARKLDRKNALRVYEWMKENYAQLEGKTAVEGANHVSGELGLDISVNTITSMARDMDFEPFWKARTPKQDGNGKDHNGGLELALKDIETALEGHARAIMQQKASIATVLRAEAHQNTSLNRLSTICSNLVARIEAIERELAEAHKHQASIETHKTE